MSASAEKKVARQTARKEFFNSLRSTDLEIPGYDELSSSQSSLSLTANSLRSPTSTASKSTSKLFASYYAEAPTDRRRRVSLKYTESFIAYEKPPDFNPLRWIRTLNDVETPIAFCLCLHGIGGTHINFLPWAPTMAQHHIRLLAACLPGRMNRIQEPAVNIQDAAHCILDALVSLQLLSTSLPLWVFGHNLGALIAYELGKLLIHHHPETQPQLHLLISCCPNPIQLTTINTDPFSIKYSEAPLKEFYPLLLQEGFLSGEVIRRMNNIFVPLFRKDIAMYESYTARTTDKYAGVSLHQVDMVFFETKLHVSRREDEEEEYEEEGDVAGQSKLFSEDYLASLYLNFKYSWEDILGRDEVDTEYFRVEQNSPFYFVHSQRVADRVAALILRQDKEEEKK